MKYPALVMGFVFICSCAWAAESQILRDDLDGRTLGKAVGVTYAPGRSGQAVVLSSPSDTIEYPSSAFALKAGRIEFDVSLTKPLSPDHKFWCLFSDIGAAASHYGAINVHWREGSRDLEYGIFDGGEHHWCFAKNLDWGPGEWHHIAMTYGPEGMKLEVDGRQTDANPYAGGLSATAKRIGFDDSYVDAPPVMVDNFRTYGNSVNSLEISDPVILRDAKGSADACTITYSVAEDSSVTLSILREDGHPAKTLVDRVRTRAGEHSISFDGKGLKEGRYAVALSVQTAGRPKALNEPLWIYSTGIPRHARFFDGYVPTGVWYFWEDDASYINRRIDDPKRARAYYERTFDDLARHNVNLIIANWTPRDHRRMLLDEAAKHGIKVIVHLDEINSMIGQGKSFTEMLDAARKATGPVKDHPAVAGYYLMDEPSNSPENAKRIAMARKAVEIADPKHPGFSCLLGGYEDLLKTVDYRVLLVDIYPLGSGWNGDFSGYISELERGRRNAGDRPLWVIPQAFGKQNAWKIPSPEEIRAEVWLALASGAKGVVYFLYQSTTGIQGEWLQGLVGMDLKQMDARWDEIAKINSDVKKLAPTLSRLKPMDLNVPVTGGSVFARGFADPLGARYVFIVNKDTKRAVTARWSGGSATDVLTGLRVQPRLALKPGEGKLLAL